MCIRSTPPPPKKRKKQRRLQKTEKKTDKNKKILNSYYRECRTKKKQVFVYCVKALRPCNTKPNMMPLATLGSCRQSKTLPKASPLAAWPMTLVRACGIPLSTRSLLALILSFSLSSSDNCADQFSRSSLVGMAFSRTLRMWYARPASDVLPSRTVVCKREVMEESCGFPGRRR